jgi:hypothetical protein
MSGCRHNSGIGQTRSSSVSLNVVFLVMGAYYHDKYVRRRLICGASEKAVL